MEWDEKMAAGYARMMAKGLWKEACVRIWDAPESELARDLREIVESADDLYSMAYDIADRLADEEPDYEDYMRVLGGAGK